MRVPTPAPSRGVSHDRRVLAAYVFLGAVIVYLIGFAPDDELRRSAIVPAFTLFGAVVLGDLGFKSWDYKNQLAAAPTSNAETE